MGEGRHSDELGSTALRIRQLSPCRCSAVTARDVHREPLPSRPPLHWVSDAALALTPTNDRWRVTLPACAPLPNGRVSRAGLLVLAGSHYGIVTWMKTEDAVLLQDAELRASRNRQPFVFAFRDLVRSASNCDPGGGLELLCGFDQHGE